MGETRGQTSYLQFSFSLFVLLLDYYLPRLLSAQNLLPPSLPPHLLLLPLGSDGDLVTGGERLLGGFQVVRLSVGLIGLFAVLLLLLGSV